MTASTHTLCPVGFTGDTHPFYSLNIDDILLGQTHIPHSIPSEDLSLFACPDLPNVDFTLPKLGNEPLVQTFYEGPKKCTCCINWVEREPVQPPKQAEEKYQKAAIRIYKCKTHHASDANGPKPTVMGGLSAIAIAYIEIQSPIIRREIGPILTECGLETLSTETIKLHPPFKQLYFAHTRILDIAKRQEADTQEREHMQVLVDVLEEIFAEAIPEIKALHKEEKITSKYLWTIFPKHIVAYSKIDHQDRLLEVTGMSDDAVEYRYVTFDGSAFGWTTMRVALPSFSGIRKISSLPIYPVGYHSDKGLHERLIARSRKLLEYQGIVHCNHIRKSSFSLSGKGIDRVVIDVFGYYNADDTRHYPHTAKLPLECLEDEKSKAGEKHDVKVTKPLENKIGQPKRLSENEREENKMKIQSKSQWLLLLSPILYGLSFSHGYWQPFCVDDLGPASWHGEALDSLVFPESQKNLMLAFVTNFRQSLSRLDHIMPGKGQGLVILLSGPPGTGKTLTVEAIAERAKRPLYRIKAKDIDEGSIESTLREASCYSKEYGSILLIDEADVFLHRRSTEYSSRNNLVAEMLREAEYYGGVMFLTTNLVKDIDEAFLSRVNMHYIYPSLSATSRLKIWKDGIFCAQNESSQETLPRPSEHPATAKTDQDVQIDISEEDLKGLASWKLNGREVKNATKIAWLLCQYDHIPLTRSILETAIRTTAPYAVEEVTEPDEASSPRKRARM